MKYKISACIVMYKNDIDMFRRCIQSFLNTKINVYLFLIDNSPKDDLKCLADDFRIQYLHNPANLGFGAGHNIVMNDPS